MRDAVLAGERRAIGQAITLVESARTEDQVRSAQLIDALIDHAGKSLRVGITGVPGVGKSTFIDALGMHLIEAGHQVAVLAVDPSSSRTGGSILGDKTRMERLSVHPNAFIRPSPASGVLGGVARATRESMIILEAAGYDIILVETVGVGQSETVVAQMVDFFLVLMLPGAGDELQGIKKGVLEIADMIAVNKADADELKANMAVRDYTAALHLLTPASATWQPPVVSCSGLTGDGLDELWKQIELHQRLMGSTGERDERRRRQQVGWMWALVDNQLRDELHSSPDVASLLSELIESVATGNTAPGVAASTILDAFRSR